MHKITKHPILDIPIGQQSSFLFEKQEITGDKGFTIAAALHQAGHPVHSHSLSNRERSLECGIGKCGACEMLVDGQIKRICITPVDGVKEVKEIPHDYAPYTVPVKKDTPLNIYKTTVAIIGAGPAGLAAREELNHHKVHNIVIDNNDKIAASFSCRPISFFSSKRSRNSGGCGDLTLLKHLPATTMRGFS